MYTPLSPTRFSPRCGHRDRNDNHTFDSSANLYWPGERKSLSPLFPHHLSRLPLELNHVLADRNVLERQERAAIAAGGSYTASPVTDVHTILSGGRAVHASVHAISPGAGVHTAVHTASPGTDVHAGLRVCGGLRSGGGRGGGSGAAGVHTGLRGVGHGLLQQFLHRAIHCSDLQLIYFAVNQLRKQTVA